MSDEEAVPEFIPVVSRTSSDELTNKMHMIDVRLACQDGPPELPFDLSETEVVDVSWDDDTDVDWMHR